MHLLLCRLQLHLFIIYLTGCISFSGNLSRIEKKSSDYRLRPWQWGDGNVTFLCVFLLPYAIFHYQRCKKRKKKLAMEFQQGSESSSNCAIVISMLFWNSIFFVQLSAKLLVDKTTWKVVSAFIKLSPLRNFHWNRVRFFFGVSCACDTRSCLTLHNLWSTYALERSL